MDFSIKCPSSLCNQPIFFIGALIIYIAGQPWYFDRVTHDLVRAGLVTSAADAPVLLRQYSAEGCTVWEFRACGIPLANWQEKQAEIQSALNISAVKIIEGDDHQTILLYSVSPIAANTIVPWADSIVKKSDSFITLGRGLQGVDVTIDLCKTPHILIGGSTGSGKSVLLKIILLQTIKHGDAVFLADFKGGVDFPAEWHINCTIITEESELLKVLNAISTELQRRKELFVQSGVAGIEEYRQKVGPLQRIIFACDEAAELLDRTGTNKERKELLDQIESKISLIARQGRAFGINLILATQRPDANIVPGQIKNNMDVRICGKADATLSGIILGSGDADKLIPKDSQGRFLMNDGTIFQGFDMR